MHCTCFKGRTQEPFIFYANRSISYCFYPFSLAIHSADIGSVESLIFPQMPSTSLLILLSQCIIFRSRSLRVTNVFPCSFIIQSYLPVFVYSFPLVFFYAFLLYSFIQSSLSFPHRLTNLNSSLNSDNVHSTDKKLCVQIFWPFVTQCPLSIQFAVSEIYAPVRLHQAFERTILATDVLYI